MGRVLHVDLTEGRLRDEPINEQLARAFLGGSGLAACIIYDMVDRETDPLGPCLGKKKGIYMMKDMMILYGTEAYKGLAANTRT